MKKKYGEDFYLKRFQEVVCFLTASKIQKKFGTLEKYYAAKNSSKAYNLNIKWNILFHLSRVGSTHKMNEFIAASENLFKYHRHCHKTYKDDLNATPLPKQNSEDSGKKPKGKHFSRNSWFELSDQVLEDYFAAPEDNFNTKTCHFLSKEAHKFIDWRVFKYKIYKYDTSPKPKNRETDMTNKEKEKIRKECAEGKHACSADYLIKQHEKDERRQAKKEQRRVDKSNEQLQQALKKIEELEKCNAELRAELKAQAEREVPDDSVCCENGTLCYEIDEQDKQLIAACEAELARDTFLDRYSSDDALADDKEALVDECIEILRRKHEANASAPYKSVSSIDDPTLVKRITRVKNCLQQAFDLSYLSSEEAKLYLRAKFGMKLELDRQHAIDWNKYQTLESVDWRRKLFKEADEAIARGEWSYASQDDIEMVRDRHETLENQIRRLKTA